jgi:hypothetical protein
VQVGYPAPDSTSITVQPPWSSPWTSYISPTNTAPTAEWEVEVGSPAQEVTITSTLSPGSPPYTSTFPPANPTISPWTEMIGSPAPYVTTYSYLHSGEPAFTSTGDGTITVGVPVPAQTITTTLPPNEPGYTAQETGANPTAPWRVLIVRESVVHPSGGAKPRSPSANFKLHSFGIFRSDHLGYML